MCANKISWRKKYLGTFEADTDTELTMGEREYGLHLWFVNSGDFEASTLNWPWESVNMYFICAFSKSKDLEVS